MDETTLYCCQRCGREFRVPGIKATVEACPKCNGVAEPAVDVHPAVMRAPSIGNAVVDESCRLAMLKVPYDHILDLLRWSMREEFPRVVQRIVGCNIPDGVRVIEVHSDFLSRCFCITLQHSSFAVVPEGEMIPGLPGSTHMMMQSIDCPPPGFVTKKCEVSETGTVLLVCEQVVPKFDGGSPPESPVIRFGEREPPGSQG